MPGARFQGTTAENNGKGMQSLCGSVVRDWRRETPEYRVMIILQNSQRWWQLLGGSSTVMK